MKANNKCWQRGGEKRFFAQCWWKGKLEHSFKKLKIELPYDTAIPLIDRYPKETKPGCWLMPAFSCLFQMSTGIKDMETV
jgi:hypothetical protein